MILLTRLEITNEILSKYPGMEPEFDIDFDAIEATNKAQLKKVVALLRQRILAKYWLDTENKCLGGIEFRFTGTDWEALLKEVED